MDLKGLVDSRYSEVQQRMDKLTEQWSPFIRGVNDYVKSERGEGLSIHETRNLAQCLDNAFMSATMKSKTRMLNINEATTEDDIAFLGIQLPVIAALLPSLALNDVALVQSLDRRVGGVFYLDVEYASNKGEVTDGQTMISSKTGHDRTMAGRTYASTRVMNELIEGSDSASGGDVLTGTTLAYAPGVSLQNGTIVLKDGNGVVIASNADSNAEAGDNVGTFTNTDETVSVTVNAAGEYTIELDSAYDVPTGGLFISYTYQYDLPEDGYGNRTGVPKAKINVTMDTITAMDFPLRSEYSIGAALDLMKAHGINLENELVKYLGNEVRWTIDQYGLNMMDDAAQSAGAASAITAWNAKIGSGQEWLWKKHEFLDRFEEGNINIIDKTLRAVANFMVVGNNVARVIKQLPNFKPVANLDKSLPTGPVKIGTIDGRTVVQNPFFASAVIDGITVLGKNRYFMGYRGSDYLHAGFVYAPYIPLMTTPTITTSDLFSQKGFLSAAGFKTINNGMFTQGYITNLGTTDVD